MAFGWILVLITAMVSTRATNKLKRAAKDQKKGNYIALDESDSDTDSIDWDKLMEEDSTFAASKGKTPTSVDKGKAQVKLTPLSMKRKRIVKRIGRARGVEIQAPAAHEQSPVDHDVTQISSERMKAFEFRECIGERHVNIAALRDRCSPFGRLVNKHGLVPICSFPEKTGYCVQLVRTFYLYSNNLLDNEGGPLEFRTTVRNTSLTITPQLIGEVIGMKVKLDGTHYLKAAVPTTAVWKEFVKEICLPGTCSTGKSVLSKDLKQEYRFMNFIVCFNILPNLQTKVLRWDRMFYLFLLGNPIAAEGLNINVPYIIWSRMARYVENPHPTERLPYPMIIMRILRKFNIDTASSTYMHSSGTINDSTIVKSLSTRQCETPTPPRSTRPAAAASTAQARQAPASASESDVSITSIYREQQRMFKQQEHICQELELITAAQVTLTKKYNSIRKMVKKISEKMGCSNSDDSDSES